MFPSSCHTILWILNNERVLIKKQIPVEEFRQKDPLTTAYGNDLLRAVSRTISGSTFYLTVNGSSGDK